MIPKVVNAYPGDSSTFSPGNAFRFGVRDADFRVNHRQINAFALFSGQGYDPSLESAALPLDPPFAFDVFSDTTPVTVTAERVDLLLGEGSGDAQQVLVLSSSSTSKKSSVLFLHTEAAGPTGAGFRFGVPGAFTRAAASPYQSDNPDYAGALFGFVHWGRKTGVFVFCSETSGGTKYLRITGPLTSSGRLVSEEVEFDWTSSASSLRIFFDDSGYLGVAMLLAVDEATQEETKLFECPISDLGKLIPTARLGYVDSESAAADAVSAFIGIDQTREGDLELYALSVDTFGTPLVVSAGTESSHSGTTHASGIIVGAQQADLSALQTDGASWLDGSNQLIFESDGSGSSVRSEEPQLTNGKWLLYFHARPDQEVHLGSYNTGMGATVSSGEFITQVRFLSDGTKDLGVFAETETDSPLLSANYVRISADWEDAAPHVLLVGDGVDLLEAHSSAAPNLPMLTSLMALPEVADPSEQARFDYGIIDEGPSGFFVTESFMFIPLKETHYVDLTSWDLEGLAATVDLFTSIRPTDSDQVSFYHTTYSEEEYEPGTTGIVLVVQARVGDITDPFSGVNPVRVPGPAIFSIQLGDGQFVQLQCLLSEAGERFVYVSQDAQDHKEVLNPASALGELISAQVDYTQWHFYVLAVQPGLGLRLFVDFNPEPAIFISWEAISVAMRADTANLLEGISVAVGSIPTLQSGGNFNRADLDVSFAAVGIGSGYDFSVTLGTPRDVLESKVYGTTAHTLFDLADTDP